jgi:hypothetical protein
MKRFVGLGLALADGVGEAAPSVTLTWMLGTGVAAASPASDGSPQAATAASMAAATAVLNARCQRRRGREGFISKISLCDQWGRVWMLRLRLALKRATTWST